MEGGAEDELSPRGAQRPPQDSQRVERSQVEMRASAVYFGLSITFVIVCSTSVVEEEGFVGPGSDGWFSFVFNKYARSNATSLLTCVCCSIISRIVLHNDVVHNSVAQAIDN